MLVACGFTPFVYGLEESSSREQSSVSELFKGAFTATVVVPFGGAGEIIQAIGEENKVTECFPTSARTVVNGALALGVLSAAAVVVHDLTGLSGEAATVGAILLISYFVGFRKWASQGKKFVPGSN